jgi:hypothetical protein
LGSDFPILPDLDCIAFSALDCCSWSGDGGGCWTVAGGGGSAVLFCCPNAGMAAEDTRIIKNAGRIGLKFQKFAGAVRMGSSFPSVFRPLPLPINALSRAELRPCDKIAVARSGFFRSGRPGTICTGCRCLPVAVELPSSGQIRVPQSRSGQRAA